MVVKIIDTEGSPEYNKDLYEALFAEANEKLPDDDSILPVTDLNSYFNALSYLRANATGSKFIRIPLDEEPIRVEANTRKLIIPQALKQNGLGVQGDHLCEVLFFEIDRFYDTMDLDSLVDTDNTSNNDSGCFIQWSNGQESHSDKAYAVDVIDTKLVFGWVVNKRVTEVPGNVTFSVRFVQRNSGGIVFDFNTLPATCVVNKSLTLDDVEVFNAQDFAGIMNNRATYSGIVNTADGAKPVLLSDLEAVYDFAGTEGEAHPKLVKVNDTPNEDGTYNYKLVLEAKSPDGGQIEYQWFKGAPEGGVKTVVNGASGTLEAGSNEISLGVHEAGTYFVKIGNVKNNTKRYIESNTATVPAPHEIEMVTHSAIGFAGSNLGVSQLPAFNTVVYDPITELSVAVSGNIEGDVVKYQWQTLDANGETWSDISGATEATYDLTESDFPVDAYTVDKKVTYRCKMENTRNQTATKEYLYSNPGEIYSFPVGLSNREGIEDSLAIFSNKASIISRQESDARIFEVIFAENDEEEGYVAPTKNLVYEWSYTPDQGVSTGYHVGGKTYAFEGEGTYNCRVYQKITTPNGITQIGIPAILAYDTFNS